MKSLGLQGTEDQKNETWAQHQSKAAILRLVREADKMEHDLEFRKERLKRVKEQIANLEVQAKDNKNGDVSDDQHHWWRVHLLWIISGVVNGVLKMSFCIVFGSLIHESAGDLLSDSISVGVGVQLVSAFITCLITAKYSTVGISISGPDIIQALMLANMAKVIERMTHEKDAALATILFLSASSTLLIALNWLLIVRYRLMG